jgi:hypothetical protein
MVQHGIHLCICTPFSWASVNQHQPVHQEGWMVSGQETVFCWVPVPYLLTMVLSSVAFLPYLPPNKPPGMLLLDR